MESSLCAPPPVLYSLGFKDKESNAPNVGIHVPFFTHDLEHPDVDPVDDTIACGAEIDSDTASKLDADSFSAPTGALSIKQKRKKGVSKKGSVAAGEIKAEAVDPMVDFSSDAYFDDLFSDLLMPGSDDPFMTDDTLFLDGAEDLNLPGISPGAAPAPVHVKGVPALAMPPKADSKLAEGLLKGSTNDAKKLFVDEDWFYGLDTSWALTGPQTPRHTDHDPGKHGSFSTSADANRIAMAQISKDDLKMIVGALPRSARKTRSLIHIVKKTADFGGPMVPVADARRSETPETGDPVKRAYRRKSAAMNGTTAALAGTDLPKVDPHFLELMRRRAQNRSRTNSNGSENVDYPDDQASQASADSGYSVPGLKPTGKAKVGKRAAKATSALSKLAQFSAGPMSGEGYTHPVPGVPHINVNGLSMVPSNSPSARLDGVSPVSGRSTPITRKHIGLSGGKSHSLRYKNTKTLESLNRTFWRYENMRSFSAERLKAETLYPKSNHTTSKKHTGQLQTSVAAAFPAIFSSTRHALSFGVHGEDSTMLKKMFPRCCGDIGCDSKLAAPYSSQVTSIATSGIQGSSSVVNMSVGSALTPFGHADGAPNGQSHGDSTERPSSVNSVSHEAPIVEIKKEPNIEFNNTLRIDHVSNCNMQSKSENQTENAAGSSEDFGVTTTCSSTGSSDTAEGEDAGQKTSPDASVTEQVLKPAAGHCVAPVPIPAIGGGTGIRSYVSPLLMASRAIDVEDAMNQSYAKFHLHSSTVAPELVGAKATLDGFNSMCAAAKTAAIGQRQSEIDLAALAVFNATEGPLALARSAAPAVSFSSEMPAAVLSGKQSESGDPYDSLRDPVASLYEVPAADETMSKPGKVLRSTSADPYISSTRFLYNSNNANSSSVVLDHSMLSQLMPYMTDESDPTYAVTTKSARTYDTKLYADGTAVDMFGTVHTSIGHAAGGGNFSADGVQSTKKGNARPPAGQSSQGDANGTAVKAAANGAKKRSRAKVVPPQATHGAYVHESTAALLASKGFQFQIVSPGGRPTQTANRESLDPKAASPGGKFVSQSQMPPVNRRGDHSPGSLLRAVIGSPSNADTQQQRWEGQSRSVDRQLHQSSVAGQTVGLAAANSNGINRIAAPPAGISTADANLSSDSVDGAAAKRRRLEQLRAAASDGGIPKAEVSDPSNRGVGQINSTTNYSDISLSGNGGLLGNLNLIPSMSLPSSSGSDGMAIRSLSSMPHLNVSAPAGLNNLLLPSLPPSSAASGMSWFTPQWPSAPTAQPSNNLLKPSYPSRATSEPQMAVNAASPQRRPPVPMSAMNVASTLSNAISGAQNAPPRQQLSPPSPALPGGLLLSGGGHPVQNSMNTMHNSGSS